MKTGQEYNHWIQWNIDCMQPNTNKVTIQ